MRTHHELELLCDDAESSLRCFHPTTNALQQAAYARLRNGYLVRPHRGVYARTSYWSNLDPAERSRHIIRTLSRQFPNRVFAGLSAAAMLRLEYNWSLHNGNTVFLASPSGNARRSFHGIRHINMTNPPVSTVLHYRSGTAIRMKLLKGGPPASASTMAAASARSVQKPRGVMTADVIPADATPADLVPTDTTQTGIAPTGTTQTDLVPTDIAPTSITDMVPITSPARTLVDCGRTYPFAQVLPMFDSALRNGLVTPQQILEVCDGIHSECGGIMRLLHYANPLSENGGESFCRAMIIESGFATPQLQHTFTDMDSSWAQYRVDFVWHTEDGRVIVLEYDGKAKYTNPSMTHHQSVRSVVHGEREREDALKRAGVTTIIRADYEEVVGRTPLVRKLIDARVPRAGINPKYEYATNLAETKISGGTR
ncbi:CTP synthase [Bifidobacterium sp. UTBIF-78]|uniref:CTP synthase n=1 Tax=Bifidobacterium sp. UTBIF-78 TaxID=1465263 RepID=UPI00112823EA|nr:CTP synthase [Bifidobacterium sp. UTBIF-78]TPF94377.1 hypothetical protein BG22_05550 [Bifidobacterium sp. UTBIF-78]